MAVHLLTYLFECPWLNFEHTYANVYKRKREEGHILIYFTVITKSYNLHNTSFLLFFDIVLILFSAVQLNKPYREMWKSYFKTLGEYGKGFIEYKYWILPSPSKMPQCCWTAITLIGSTNYQVLIAFQGQFPALGRDGLRGYCRWVAL